MTALARHRVGCLSALVALAVGCLVWTVRPPAVEALRENPYFAIHDLIISGCGPALTAEDVRAWLGITDASTVWEAAPASVRGRLLEHPRIAWASARRVFPDRLEVVIRERRPQAIVVLDDLYYVDRSGATFGPLTASDSRDYLMLTGLAAESPGTRSWLVRRALRLSRRCDREACVGALSEIHLDAVNGVVVYPAAPRLPIVLGWGSWSMKLERAERALRTWKGGVEQLASLDLRFRNQIVLSLRPAASPPALDKGGAGKRAPHARTRDGKSAQPPFFPRADHRVKV